MRRHLFLSIFITILVISSTAETEESCEADNESESPRKISEAAAEAKPNQKQGEEAPDENDGDTSLTEADYLKYEENGGDSICLLEKGKCPDGDWKMFTRKGGVKVCLKIVGSPVAVDYRTGGQLCRENANARLMGVDSMQEREWIYTQDIGRNNISSSFVLITGHIHRKCMKAPRDPTKCPQDDKIVYPDLTADSSFMKSNWMAGYPLHTWEASSEFGHFVHESCYVMWTLYEASMVKSFSEMACGARHNRFLCGVTVM